MSYIGRTPTNAALTAADLADGIVSTDKIAADAVTDAKIADDVVGTEHLTANEVDTTALGADAVTGAQLADDAVNSEHYTDGSIDTAHLADGQVTTAKLATAVFTGATDIGADIADADLFLMDDGAGGTIRKTAASRIKTYAGGLTGVTTGSGNVTITDGDLIFGGAGHGVYLGVTSATAANHLDDYEEGTWTPVPRDASKTGTAITIYTPTASYTKIGRFVNVQFTIRRNDSASLSDVLFITGLPFTSNSTAMDANINGGVWVDNSSGDHMGFINMGGNNNHMTFRKSHTMDASIASNEWVNGRYLYGSANYIAS